MIHLRRSARRRGGGGADRRTWLSFDPTDPRDRFGGGIGGLRNLGETILAPNAGPAVGGAGESETLVYVSDGALEYRDSGGGAGVLRAGAFQRVDGGPGFLRTEANASDVQGAHVFRAELVGSEAGLALSEAPRRFSLALRRRGPCLVASPDAAEGSLRIRPDVRVYSALLAPGRHAVHPLLAGRVAWLHLVRGAATLGGIGLGSGDGAEIEGERSVSLTARDQTEILLFDLDGSELSAAGGAGA